jgi:4-hydroxy-2-oxoheptanedioate aldolase
MARAGWDSITVDLQHGVQDFQSMVHCFQAMSGNSVTPLVRVLGNDAAMIGKVLDAGAWGVICPMVNTAAQARSFVDACLYPPKGSRSNGPTRAAVYGEAGSYQTFANDEILVIPMIETAEAVDNLEEILDVPGVSGVYVGPSDLGLSYGLPPIIDRNEPEVLDIYKRVLAQTKKRGQFAGLHCAEASYALTMAELGFKLLTVGSDTAFVAKTAVSAVSQFRANAMTSQPEKI